MGRTLIFAVLLVGFGAAAQTPQPAAAPRPMDATPRVEVTGVQLGAKSLGVPPGSVLWVSAPLTVRFHVSGIDIGDRVLYHYRLRGFDNIWSTTENAKVSFPPLTPGSYRFEISAEDVTTGDSSAVISMPFELAAAWWRSLVTRGFVGLLVILVGWGGLRWRERVLTRRQRELEALVAERTRDLEEEKRELEEARAALHDQATRDGLTGLWNRNAILENLDEQLARCAQDNDRMAVVLLDFDHFKSVNDRYGHRRGDVVLAEAARRLSQAVRTRDRVGRYGGEEFLVLLAGLGELEGRQRLEQLRMAVSAEPIDLGDLQLNITCSCGVAWVRGGADADAVLEQADRALYAAKHAGRDRVEYANAWV